jgi:hypothetical protein
MIDIVNITSMDLTRFQKYIYIDDDFHDCTYDCDCNYYNKRCCSVFYIKSTFDYGIFRFISLMKDMTHLTLSYSDELYDHHISYMENLIYLDIGCRSRFTDDAFNNLKKLKTLKLRNNTRITKKIFNYSPDLKELQLSKNSKIKIEDIPNSVLKVTYSIYDTICEKCGGEEVELRNYIIRNS